MPKLEAKDILTINQAVANCSLILKHAPNPECAERGIVKRARPAQVADT